MHKGDVAVFIGHRAAEQSHIHREALVEEIFLTAEGHQLSGVLLSLFVHAATLQARVDKCAQAHFGQQTGPTGGDLAPQIHGHALGHAVAGDLALSRQGVQCIGAHDVSAGPAGHKALAGLAQTGCAADACGLFHALRQRLLVPAQEVIAVAMVAHGAALFEVQIFRVACLLVAIPNCAADLFSPAGYAQPGHGYGSTIGDQLRCFFRGNELSHTLLLFENLQNIFIELVP